MALNGTLSDMSVADLIQTQCGSGGRAALLIRRAGQECAIYFDAGAVIHAVCGEAVGASAVYELLTWESGAFEVVPHLRPALITIKAPWSALIMEGMRRYDEQRAARVDGHQPHAQQPDVPAGAATHLGQLEQLLRDLIETSRDVVGAVIADLDGQVLVADVPARMTAEQAGAVAAGVANFAQRSMRQLVGGTWDVTAIRGTEGDLVLAPVGAYAALIAVAQPDANLGMVFLQARACAAKATEILG